MITDIQCAEFTEGKNSILYYADDSIINEYLSLKMRVDELTAENLYGGTEPAGYIHKICRIAWISGKNYLEQSERDQPLRPVCSVLNGHFLCSDVIEMPVD